MQRCETFHRYFNKMVSLMRVIEFENKNKWEMYLDSTIFSFVQLILKLIIPLRNIIPFFCIYVLI